MIKVLVYYGGCWNIWQLALDWFIHSMLSIVCVIYSVIDWLITPFLHDGSKEEYRDEENLFGDMTVIEEKWKLP